MAQTYLKDPATGDVRINPAKSFILNYILLPDPPVPPPVPPAQPFTVPAAGIGPPMIFTGPQEGPFEAHAITLAATDKENLLLTRFRHRLRDLVSDQIHVRTMWGGQIDIVPAATFALGVSPFYLQTTLWLMPRETIEVQFRDLSGTDNVVKVAIHGRLYVSAATPQAVMGTSEAYNQAKRKNEVASPFWYTTNLPPIAVPASGTVRVTIQVAADGAFLWQKLTARATSDNYRIQWWDERGRALVSQPMHHDLGVGNADFPYIFVEPTLYKRNAIITIEITDLSASLNNIYLTLSGQRIYQGDQYLP